MVRLIAFSCVILAHVINGVNNMADPNVAAISMSMHFTRNAFFFLTALVLTYQYRNRKPGVFSFWRKRIWVVAVPYVIWSAVYTVIKGPSVTLPVYAHDLGINLLTGASMYNMYFLVVSIQFYLLFPLFLAGLKAMRHRPVLTIAVAAAAQYVINSFETVASAPNAAFLGELWPYLTSLLPSYLVYFVIGGVLALHLDAVTEWVRHHLWHTLGLAVLGLATALANYYTNVAEGVHPFGASSALQPGLMVWCVPAVVAVYALGVRWADRRREGSVADKVLAAGTERAFGIFLAHPLILAMVYENMLGGLIATLGFVGATAATFLLGVAGTLVLVEILRRTPWSKQLVGRAPAPWLGDRTRNAFRTLARRQPA